MLPIWIAIAAFAGGITNALLGWTQTDDPFNGRKFASSAIASFIGAIVVAVGFNFANIGTDTITLIVSLGTAFLSGAGVSAGTSRVSGSIR